MRVCITLNASELPDSQEVLYADACQTMPEVFETVLDKRNGHRVCR